VRRWFERCDTAHGLSNAPRGFLSAEVVNANATKRARRRRKSRPKLDGQPGETSEVDLRHGQLLDYSAAAQYNLSEVEHFLQHERLRGQIANGVHLRADGSRWSYAEFREHMNGIYVVHNRQSETDRQRLGVKWGRPLLGQVDVWSLLHLLHFTIDHTDGKLFYTSQFIHCLQVYAAVRADPMPERDAEYRRDMRIAAIVHDMGKLLTLFGEEDGNVDCMNRVLPTAGGTPPPRGLDRLEVQWNHDEFGFMKLRPHLPPRVADVMRYHSLREIPYIVTPNFAEYEHRFVDGQMAWMRNDPTVQQQRLLVTAEEVRAVSARMDAADVARAKFVAHFAYYDRMSKMETDEIPIVDVEEVQELIRHYFPQGRVAW